MKPSILKKNVLRVVGFCFLSCLMTGKAHANEQDWEFVQSIGGMKFGKPEQKDGNWILPVDVDVSGSKTITVKPTLTNTSLVCEGVQAEIHGTQIYLALFTGQPWLGTKIGTCPPIVLGHLEQGKYTLFYNGLNAEPVKISDITLEP